MTSPTQPAKKPNLQEELEKKLAHIGAQERSLESQQLAKDLGLPYAELMGLPLDPDALRMVPEETARASSTTLVQFKGTIGVAVTTDPRTDAAKAVLHDLAQKYPQLKVVIISPTTLQSILARYATVKTTQAFEAGAITVNDDVVAKFASGIKTVDDLRAQLKGASVTELFEVLVAGALAVHASDIHCEPEVDTTRIRYRLDGLLHEITTVEKPSYQRVLNRIKVLSKMKLNVTKAPQDGRFTIRQSDIEIEVRVSVLPSEYGESVVMRLLDPRGIHAKLEDLGMRADVLAQVQELLKKPQGTLLTTGPTGSGKTTTLYAFLNSLNTPDMKIITVEDPIEYHIAGLNQTQVDPAKGYTFASGLRAIVRQDPDIILIGEIRDLETADIALEAALTGHLVLSTIHTNDAAGTVPRLVDLGVKAETIAPALTMAMGQRLLRRLCPECKKPLPLEKADLDKLQESMRGLQERFHLPSLDSTLVPFGPVGCDACGSIGYRGRIGVYEVFEVAREMEKLILVNPNVSDIRDQAIAQGMVTMLQDGYLKLIEGTTSIEEIRRVLG